jgi:hypothetical protein
VSACAATLPSRIIPPDATAASSPRWMILRITCPFLATK